MYCVGVHVYASIFSKTIRFVCFFQRIGKPLKKKTQKKRELLKKKILIKSGKKGYENVYLWYYIASNALSRYTYIYTMAEQILCLLISFYI